MKKLTCDNCNTYLGEMQKGRIKKNAVILCKPCHLNLIANRIKPKSNYSDPLQMLNEIIGK